MHQVEPTLCQRARENSNSFRGGGEKWEGVDRGWGKKGTSERRAMMKEENARRTRALINFIQILINCVKSKHN